MYTRAAAMGLLFTTGNSAGIISSNVYPARTAPRFVEGHSIAIGFSGLAIVCALMLMYANSRENARRDREYGKMALDGSDANPAKMKGLSEEKRKRWGLQDLSELEIIELGDRHPGGWYYNGVPNLGYMTDEWSTLRQRFDTSSE